ncbi:hypothetical protein L195_g037213 [Trifolium pratense]|uniref:Uncharacterized protein n=1 Tax=Trifolium pratense TaxID=57577 RepID=A0A2K3LRM8_TRIPR|nr:hypothetical protein L195_g037213 [Trifolium pratense]
MASYVGRLYFHSLLEPSNQCRYRLFATLMANTKATRIKSTTTEHRLTIQYLEDRSHPILTPIHEDILDFATILQESDHFAFALLQAQIHSGYTSNNFYLHLSIFHKPQLLRSITNYKFIWINRCKSFRIRCKKIL